ncbi:hypothetical protein MKOR_00410 [Mycolicibacillus koreensis]|nr:hypothetical protein MKOR_00410 [Mycolicibacillus koreensis]
MQVGVTRSADPTKSSPTRKGTLGHSDRQTDEGGVALPRGARFLVVAAEFFAHRRDCLVGELVEVAGRES